MSSIKSNIADYLAQIETLTNTNLQILKALNDSFFTKKIASAKIKAPVHKVKKAIKFLHNCYIIILFHAIHFPFNVLFLVIIITNFNGKVFGL